MADRCDRDREKLEDIRGALTDIQEFSRNLDFDDFRNSKTVRYAILHALTIVGEAANQLSAELLSRHDDIPWSRVIGMRHRVVHGYGVLDLTLLWDVITRMVPDLLIRIDGVLTSEFDEQA
ncbi:MAG: DUF86 domain-containing protein [Bryobacterales bacterium]|nr:DUF86 domain-containing protein [Bryobacterales bacterium]